MRAPSDKELRELIPRSLLRRAAIGRVPLERLTLTFDETFELYNGEPFWDTLVALSKFGPEVAANIDFFASGVLPHPEDHDFPVMALGLSCLLDAAPAALLKGVNSRWGCYFRIFATKFMYQLKDMPNDISPLNRGRWEKELGLTTDQWIWAVNVLLTACVHSEILELHEWSSLVFDRAARTLRDVYPGVIDPYEKELEGEFGSSIYTFAREVQKGIPTKKRLGREREFADAMYWYKMIDHVHAPVIQHFGRYPYRNLAMGRESTPEEIQYQEEIDHFAEIDAENARQIRQDVEKGIWRPLQR